MLRSVASPSPDEQTHRPAQPDDRAWATVRNGRVDAGSVPGDRCVEIDLHLTVERGDRLSGTVGRLGDTDRRFFRGWLDLMCAIDQLRGGSARDSRSS